MVTPISVFCIQDCQRMCPQSEYLTPLHVIWRHPGPRSLIVGSKGCSKIKKQNFQTTSIYLRPTTVLIASYAHFSSYITGTTGQRVAVSGRTLSLIQRPDLTETLGPALQVQLLPGKEWPSQSTNKPPNFMGYAWYKGQRENTNNFIASLSRYPLRRKSTSEQELVEFDGSLVIKRVTMKHAGDYTVVVYLKNGRKEIGFGRLTVYEPLRVPTLLASKTIVTENQDAVELTCYTNGISISWLFNAVRLKLTERMKLSPDNRVLTIDPVRREDAGSYQCEGSNAKSSIESWPVELNVKYK
ncbi:cell adhesion molecule CEACAM15-like [Rhynchonycteris naso]